MRSLLCAIAFSSLAAAPFAVAQEVSVLTAEQRTEHAVDLMMFDSGLFVAAVTETEPYMNPAVRQDQVRTLVQNMPQDQADSVRAYMATFDERFNETLARERPGMVSRLAAGLESTLSAEERASAEQFLLNPETGALFVRLMQLWISRGGGDVFNRNDFTEAEFAAFATFMQSPGSAILTTKSAPLDALMDAELNSFVPVFEREFASGLCAIVGGGCPDWMDPPAR